MWRAALLAATIAVECSISLGYAVDDIDPVELQLQNELWELEHEGHRRHHAHHHSPKRFLGLMGRPAAVKPPPGLDAELLPGRHAAVTKKLHDMDKELHNLKGMKENNAQAHLNLEGEVKEAFHHMDSVVTIKSQLAKTQVQIRSEERKLKKLEEDRTHLDMTHRSLSDSLRHIMEPKIGYAASRLEKRKHQLHELEGEDDLWRAKRDKFHKDSLGMIEQRDQAKSILEQAIVAEERAHKERKLAEKLYGEDKKQTSSDIQAYKFSDVKERAAMSKVQRSQEETNQADVSVKRLQKILAMEQRRVDNSMAIGKDKVAGKIRAAEGLEKASEAKLVRLRNEFDEWQVRQEALAGQIVSQKGSTYTATKNFANTQENMLASARDQVVSDAESDSDWEGWDEWSGRKGDDSIP